MRVADDMTYFDLGLVQPQGGHEVGELFYPGVSTERKVPNPSNITALQALRLTDSSTGEVFTFQNQTELANFKFQRYMQRYLRVVQSVDDNVGRMLDWLDEKGLANNTLVMYSSVCFEYPIAISVNSLTLFSPVLGPRNVPRRPRLV